ncbi:MAG TPA: inositol monophosphatase family protein, partial [Gemmatimonadaceae bacterium]|nr:inositol monophosphatase family protein [Gemmatimonadaceae bacterium]
MQGNSTSTTKDTRIHKQLLEASVSAADAAAEIIRGESTHVSSLVWEHKGVADFVTRIDRAAESAIAEVLTANFPDALVIGEELTPDDAVRGTGLEFVVDPLDGTTNFLPGYPQFAVSIAAIVDGDLVAATVLNVASDERFTAALGCGAQRNGVRMQVSSETRPERALIGTGFPFKRHDLLEEYARQFVRVSRETAGIRRAGSAALDLADVACGRFDGFWELVLAPWDIAAGVLLVREAGGIVTELDGAGKK